MTSLQFASLAASAGLLATLATGNAARASAIYYCNNGNCSGSGGNGDNGTNNGNNSSNNTINVNLPATGTSALAQQYAYARQAYGYANPVGLPSVVPLSCGSRTTAYAGLTGAPAGGAGANMAFGIGLLSPIGREPDICRPQALLAQPAQSSAVPNPTRSAQSLSMAPASTLAPAALPAPAWSGMAGFVPLPPAATAGATQLQYIVYNPATQTSYVMIAQPAIAAPAIAPEPALAISREDTPVSTMPVLPSLRGTYASIDAPKATAPGCAHLDGDVAAFYEHDLHDARKYADSARIVRDIRALDEACYHAFVVRAFAAH